MTLRSLLAAVALSAPALAAPTPAPAPEPAPAASPATTLLPSHPVHTGAKRTTRTAATRRAGAARAAPLRPAGGASAARAGSGRTSAGERAAAPRVVPVSGVVRGFPEPVRPDHRAAPDGAAGGLELGALAGWEAANVSGPSFRIDGAAPVLDLGPRVSMAAVVSAGYSRLADRIGFLDLRADVFKLVPAARFSVPLGARFSVFADVGFGVAYVRARLASTDPAAVTVTAPSDRSVNAMARVGVGAWYHATRRLKVGALAEMDPIFGDFAYAGAAAQNTFLVQGGLMFRL